MIGVLALIAIGGVVSTRGASLSSKAILVAALVAVIIVLQLVLPDAPRWFEGDADYCPSGWRTVSGYKEPC